MGAELDRADTKERGRWLLRGLAPLLSALLTLGLVELGLRVIRPGLSYQGWLAQSLLYLPDEQVDWVLEPQRYPWGQVNEDHFRGPRLTVDKPPSTYRILVLGGSAAFDLWKRDGHTWPDLLAQRLQGHVIDGRKVELLNAATPGYSTWQSVRLLEARLLPYRPDLVLVYHLYNDSLMFRFPERSLIELRWQLNGLHNYRCPAVHPGTPFDVVGMLLPKTADVTRALWIEHACPVPALPDFPTRGAHPVGLAFYRDNLIRIGARLQAAGGIPFAIVTQASVIRAQPTPASAAVIHYALRGMDHAQLWQAYQWAYQTAAEVAEQAPNGFLIRAHERIPPTPEYFHDEVHLNASGSQLLAQHVADALRRLRPEFAPPPQRTPP